MSHSNRRSYLAARGLVVAAVLLCCLAPVSNGIARESPSYGSQYGRNAEQRERSTEYASPSIAFKIELVQAPAAQDSESASEQRAEQRAKNDLKAQQRMARAAEWQVVVAAVTAVLLGLTLWLTRRAVIEAGRTTRAATKAAEAAEEQVRLSRDAMIHTQRAFVFVRGLIFSALVTAEQEDIVAGWTVAVDWENSGETPTKRLLLRTNLALQAEPLTDDFDFPDYGADNVPNLIGPKASLASGPLAVSLESMKAVAAGTSHLYLWGWAEYDDVFEGTCRHRTEFCRKIGVGGDPATKKVSLSWSTHPQHNAADDECMKPLQT
jgi:hypothetical protein